MSNIIVNLTNVAKENDLLSLEARVFYLENNPETLITVVTNYAALPDPTLHTGEFYWVENATGTAWLPGSIGGTYRQTGIYYSNGVVWEFTPSPYQATLSEVNLGLNNDKFVTAATLSQSKYIKEFMWVLDLLDNQTLNTYSGFQPYKIILINNAFGSPTVTIQVNNLPYTLGDTINFGDKFDVVASTVSVIELNCVEL